ncbi:MAG: AMP-dependent synthetase/ligase [Acutalibacteraceae bacterium]
MRKNYPFYKNEPIDSIFNLVKRSSILYGDSIAVKYKKKKQLHEKTYNELYSDSIRAAQFLLSQHLSKGHIAILGSSSYEWIVSYLGIVFAGLVVVPIDRELPENEIAELILQSDTDCILFDEQYHETVTSLMDSIRINIKNISFDRFASLSAEKALLPPVEPDKISAILYTSGTTGRSKGVMLSQRNIASNVIQGLGAVNLQHDKDVIMSVLPFNHAYEFTCTILGMIYKGVPICISSGLKYVQKELMEYKPTVMFVVPLFAETLYKKVELNIQKQNKEKQFQSVAKISNLLRKIHIDATDFLFKKIKAAFGNNLKIIMCGGAPLEEELIKKYRNIGINLFQGYGLTECSPLLTVNFDYYHRPNSVGKVVQGNSVKIVDGEIWAKGISVSKGYYNNPEETKKSFEGDWFKTGDLGYIDEDDFVFISGRKKNLIILNNGKNVSAEELEALINRLSDVSEVIVYGEDNRIIAEVFSETGKTQIVKTEIEKLNKALPHFKQIDDVVFRSSPFEKTTTKKIKRNNKGAVDL